MRAIAGLVAADQTVGNPSVNITIFALFVVVTLAIVVRASRNNRTATQYYAGGRSFTGPQNGIAISGDYLSAASFLGIAGAIALNGYDGFMYSIGFLVAWLVALLLVAELLRNTGRFTMADVLSFRLRERPVRTAAAISTIVVSLALALVLGTAGLPHILQRFYAVPNAREARRSVVWAIWLIGIFYLFTLVLGYGAGALIGSERILAAPGKVNSAAPLLAF